MAKLPFLLLTSTVNDTRVTINNLNNRIGDLTLLNTTGDSDLVQAINSVDGDIITINNRLDLLDSANVTGSILTLQDRADSNDTNFVSRARGSISVSGDLQYNSSTGVISVDVEQVYTKANFDSDLNLALSTDAVTTTDLTEGTNLYYTTTRVNSAFDTRLATKTTTNLTEGTNLYYTNARARAAVSVTDAGGDGSLSYNSSTGVITYTGPSAAEVRAHFSAGDGINISSGTISSTLRIYDVNGTQVYP